MATSEFERMRRQQEREVQQARKQAEARQKQQEKAQAANYLAARRSETARIQGDLDARVAALQSFLVVGLPKTETVDLSRLRRTAVIPRLELGELATARPAPEWAHFAPAPAGLLRRSFQASMIAEEVSQARARFALAKAAHGQAEADRQRLVAARTAQHAALLAREQAAVAQFNGELDDLTRRAQAREKAAVEECLLKVTDLVPLPRDFPSEFQVVFDPGTEHAVLEMELPGPGCVPAMKTVRYVQARDHITQVARPVKEKAELYRDVVAQSCLLVLRTLFNADPALRQVSFNGRVRHVNPATGHEERPHIISVVVLRDEFESLVLDRVRPDECLRHLRALVSPHPAELEAVEPLVHFDKSRLAFIAGLGAISDLDSRPDLMDMKPHRFEHLISELFEADPTIERVESLTTRASNDGGVDGVVYIKQPFGRSMTVVQVKQYARNRRLGPDHIRELIGAMHEVKAGNGLLVTTSDFTPIARANAAEFGRIQLIDGNNLVHMIKTLLGKDVLISDRRK